MLKLLNAQKLELLNVRIAQMLDLLNAQSPQENAQKALCLVKNQNSKIQNCGKAATIQKSKIKIAPAGAIIQKSKFKIAQHAQ